MITNNELEGMWKQAAVAKLFRNFSGGAEEGQEKLCQDIRYPNLYSDRVSPNSKSETLLLESTRSVANKCNEQQKSSL
jgi:hypothetical protein